MWRGVLKICNISVCSSHIPHLLFEREHAEDVIIIFSMPRDPVVLFQLSVVAFLVLNISTLQMLSHQTEV